MNDRDRIASYVLGELRPDERKELERRMTSEPELAAELAAMEAIASGLESLPKQGWPEGAGAEEPARPNLAAARTGRRARPALALVAVLVALGIGVGVGTALESGGGDGSGRQAPSAILRPLASDTGGSGVIRMPKAGEMELNVANLPRAGQGHYYEVWLMTDAARTVPLASFRVDRNGAATVRVPLPTDPRAFRYFDISRQAVTGGTGHSSESVLRGPTRPS